MLKMKKKEFLSLNVHFKLKTFQKIQIQNFQNNVKSFEN